MIEVDGSIHKESEQAEYDVQRQHHVENKGIWVIRFTIAEVIQETDAVLERIGEVLME